MRQRGRKSANVVALDHLGEPLRLSAPVDLNAPERKLFATMIAAIDPTHLREF